MPRDKQKGLTSRVVPQLGESNRRPGAGKAMWSVIDKTRTYKGYARAPLVLGMYYISRALCPRTTDTNEWQPRSLTFRALVPFSFSHLS